MIREGMKQFTLDKLPRRILRELDVEDAYMASKAIIAAERFGLFRLLHKKPMPVGVLARQIGLGAGAAERLCVALQSIGLLRRRGDSYANAPLATTYFVNGRSIYWTKQYSREGVENFSEFATLEQALASEDHSTMNPRKRKPNYLQLMTESPSRARDFTMMLYYLHQGDASLLARTLDLRSHHRLLDAGGGSGVMSIALAKKNPHLSASVLDIEPVCRVARGLIKREGMSKRVTSLAGDLNAHLPEGYDVVMFCDIGPVKTRQIKLAYRALPRGGMIVIADCFRSRDKTQPLEMALYRLISPTNGLESKVDIQEALHKQGFRKFRFRQVARKVGLITALKM